MFIKEIGDDEDVCEINMIESIVQNYVDHVGHRVLKAFII